MSPREFAIDVVRQLQQAGFVAYWAGGCVRDELLGRQPKDYDVATSARPDEVRNLFGRQRTVNVGVAFGVVMVIGPKPAGSIEVATFRRDSTYSDGRHPDAVTFSVPADDAQRRDFTINGMFFDPLRGEVIDFVGGREDLQHRVIRAIGNPDERIAEDKLRMLRAVRFAAVFQFEVDEATFQAVQRHADEILQVSAERITNELRLMLAHSRRATAARLLARSRLLPVLLPEGEPVYQWDDSAGSGNQAWELVLAALERLPETDSSPPLALLLRGIYQNQDQNTKTFDVPTFAERWRLSNLEAATLEFLLTHEATIFAARELPWSQVQRILVSPLAPPLLLYCEALSQAIGKFSANVSFCREKQRLPAELLDPPPLLTGNDLKRLGIPAGPRYRQLIDAVRTAQLDGQIGTPDEALALAQKIFDQTEIDRGESFNNER